MIDLATARILAQKWLDGTITESEKEIFEAWYARHAPELTEWQSADSGQILKDRIFNQLTSRLELEAAEEQVARVIALQPRRLFKWKWAVAATVTLVACAVTTYLFLHNNKQQQLAGITPAKTIVSDIKAPEIPKATLVLSNGSVIELDSAKEGSIAIEGTTKINKSAGEIVYTPDGSDTQMEYNTLKVPRGSQVVTLTLSDGSKVWLNAESSLRYPVVFGTDTRTVEITGEAYFEVAKDPKKKFRVTTNGTVTEVLGTHFNINAYNNGGDTKVTLLEGSVAISNSNTRKMLAPDQQAGLRSSGDIAIDTKVDLEAVMAWKNGSFKLTNADIQTIMAQVSRWYNAEIVYEGVQRPISFSGVVSRRSNAAVLLDAMSMTGTVKFRMEAPVQPGYAARIVVIM
ncbi:MAG: FecR domain-containing protein [Agriterribacter sp.]